MYLHVFLDINNTSINIIQVDFRTLNSHTILNFSLFQVQDFRIYLHISVKTPKTLTNHQIYYFTF